MEQGADAHAAARRGRCSGCGAAGSISGAVKLTTVAAARIARMRHCEQPTVCGTRGAAERLEAVSSGESGAPLPSRWQLKAGEQGAAVLLLCSDNWERASSATGTPHESASETAWAARELRSQADGPTALIRDCSLYVMVQIYMQNCCKPAESARQQGTP
jgi:hypothetical protein